MNRRILSVILLWLLIEGFGQKGMLDQNEVRAQAFQPGVPSVSAGSMEDRARVLFITADRNLWVVYDTELGNLYRVWIGGLEDPSLRSASFLSESPSYQGTLLFENDKEQKWRIIRKGEVSTPEVSFLGFRELGGQVILDYALDTPYGERILIEERPEISLNRERPVLKRNFTVFNTSDEIQVGIDIIARNIEEVEDVQVEGIFQRFEEQKHSYYWGSAVDIRGRLLLNKTHTSSFSIAFAPGVVTNAADNTVVESDPMPPLRTIKALDSEGIQPVLRRRSDHEVGISMKVYGIGEPIEQLAELAPGQLPNVNKVVQAIDLTQKEQFGGLDFYFITHLSGYLNVAASGEYVFRVLADDGVRLKVADSLLIEKDELQAAEPSEHVSVFLPAGIHPIEIEHFQSTGRKQLTLQWQPPWSQSFQVLQSPILSSRKEEQRFASTSRKYIKRPLIADSLRKRRVEVSAMHPSLFMEEMVIPELEGFIGGLDILSSGRLVAATWKGDGRVYVLDGDLDSLETVKVNEIASGLNKPLGLKVVDDEIFILQQQELTQLIDNDGNELIDEYRVVSNNWEVSTDYTELAIGLEYKEGYFYGVLGMPLDQDGAILIEDLHHRGVLVRIGFDGNQQIIGDGIQLSGGVSFQDNIMAISDQRNPWFSDSRVLFAPPHSIEGDHQNKTGYLDFGSIWLPVNPWHTPGQPFYLRTGFYQGDWLVGDMVQAELYRLALDKVGPHYQGAVFPFSGNLPVPISRMVELPDGSFFVSGFSLQEPWGTVESDFSTNFRLSLGEESVFEMKAIQATQEGFDIEFTRRLDEEHLMSHDIFSIHQWPNSEVRRDRTRKRSGRERLAIRTKELLSDGRTVRIKVDGAKTGHIVYFNIDPMLTSIDEEPLWSNEAWYSFNWRPAISSGAP